MSEFMENHINDLELQIAQLETAIKCYIVDIDIQKQKNKALQNRIDKAIEYIGLNEEDLNLYDIYDVNGIELFKILRGEDNEN